MAFDPLRDIALLRVDRHRPRARSLWGSPSWATTGRCTAIPAAATCAPPRSTWPTRVQAEGKDLYGDKSIVRDVLVLSTSLRPGDSGAPVVREDGVVIGMAFAVAPDRSTVGYALTTDELQAVLSGRTRGAACRPGDACAERLRAQLGAQADDSGLDEDALAGALLGGFDDRVELAVGDVGQAVGALRVALGVAKTLSPSFT